MKVWTKNIKTYQKKFKISQKSSKFTKINFFHPQNEEISSTSTAFVYLTPMLMQIFLPCYFGNEMMIASSKLSASLFHSEWIQSNLRLLTGKKAVHENMKDDLKIRAFGIYKVNLETFNSILNTAYSLFAVLKRVNGRKM